MSEAEKMDVLSRYFPYGRAQINYLVNCSKKHKFVYVETPKVACSTIKRVLQLIEVDGDQSRLPKNVHDRGNSPLATPFNIGVDPDRLFSGDEYFRFAFVRNPYTRILSAYLDKMVKNQWERNRLLPTLGFAPDAQITLLQFLEVIREVPHIHKDIHWTPQSYLLQRHRVDYHFIGRLENFAAGFERVIKKIKPDADENLFTIRADHHKTDANEKIAEYVGPRERDLILEIFENDFVDFGYDREIEVGRVQALRCNRKFDKGKNEVMHYLDFIAKAHEIIKPKSYLEIGVRDGSSFSKSKCISFGVDPAFNVTKEIRNDCHLYRMTSDDFFKNVDVEKEAGIKKFDLVFIDGMHLSEYAYRDFINTVKYCHEDSVILFDDIIPSSMDITTREKPLKGGWTGDVYKVIRVLRKYCPHINIVVVDTKPSGMAILTGIDLKMDKLPDVKNIEERLRGDEFAFSTLEELRSEFSPISPDEGLEFIRNL